MVSLRTSLRPSGSALASATLFITIIGIVMDGVAIAVILPNLASAFSIEPASATWVIIIYQVAIIGVLLPMASLSQRLGSRAIYLAGIFIFGVCALIGAVSSQFPMLVFARGGQAVGAAAIMAVNLALWRIVAKPGQIGKAIGGNATVVALAAAAGPIFAGLLLSYYDWRFVVGVPAAAMAFSLAIGSISLPTSPISFAKFDVVSAILNFIAFANLIIALSGAGQGWPWLGVIGSGALSVASFTALWLRLKATPAPLLPIDLLGRPVFSLSLGISVCAFALQMIVFVSLPFRLQDYYGLSATQIGLLFSAWPLSLAASAAFAPSLADRFGANVLCLASFCLLVAGTSLLACVHQTVWPITFALVLCGVGFGLFQPPNNKILVMTPPIERASSASGALGTARLFGQALGTAIASMALAGNLSESWLYLMATAVLIGILGILISYSRGNKIKTK